MTDKEEHAIILDYLPYGYPLDKKSNPVAQAIGEKNFTLLELIPRRGMKLELNEKAYIGEGKRDKIYYILGRISNTKLTETAKQQLEEFIAKQVSADEKPFVEFFNTAEAINTRLHQFELLPGFGRKHTEAIIKARAENLFNDLEDLKKRVSNLPDPKRAIEKRLLQEISGRERYNLFKKNS